MSPASYLRGGAALALLVVGAPVPTALAQQSAPAQEMQQAPQVAPEPIPDAAPPAVAPPPLVPAPDLPVDNPVVELPPPGSEPATARPAIPGLPVAPDGSLFSFADLTAQLQDSVVYISTSQRVGISRSVPLPRAPNPPSDELFEDFFDDQPGQERRDPRSVQSLGSGFVIDPSGLIVTNNHVIADADEIVANFADGGKLTAEVIGVDEKTDLALLKVAPEQPLPAARFGRSEQLRVGDWVLAIGNPFGFGGTVTAGIVSALDRDINSGPYDHYIQTDASINRGNSGGPLFSLGGEVVGINTAIMSPTGGSIGIGFAVPSEIAVPVIEQLREFGEVRRGWIGVRIQDVTEDFAEGLGLDETVGALIAGLSADGPAAEAGIVAGDVVVEFGGKPVQGMRALPRLVADTPPGERVDIVVLREGKRVSLEIEVGLLEDEEVAAATPGKPDAGGGDDKATPDAASMFGLKLGAITDEARRAFSIDAKVQGVLVTEVEPGSEAAAKDVEAGDVIVQVSQRAVAEPEEVTARIDELKSEGRRSVMLLVSGEKAELRFVSLRFDSQ